MELKTPSKRLFIGIPLSDEISSLLYKNGASLPPVSGVRWLPRQNLHITVCFIGNYPEDGISELLEQIGFLVSKIPVFELKFMNFSFMPVRNSRMVWTRFAANQAFHELSKSIHEVVFPEKPNAHQYIPHITLARFKYPRLRNKINIAGFQPVPEITVNQITLWESVLDKHGATYKVIKEFQLLK